MKLSSSRTGLFFALFLPVVFASRKVISSDFWWHLAGGRLIWESGIPRQNTFSHTFPEHPWQHTQWLFDALLYILESSGGLLLVEIFQVAIVVLTFTLVYDTFLAKPGNQGASIFFPFYLLGLAASRARFMPRPHLVSFLGFALLLNLWERRVRRFPLWCALVGVVWSNCHGGVIFGLATLILIAVSEALRKNGSGFKKALLAAAAFFAGSLVNPNTFYPYVYTFSHLELAGALPISELRGANLRDELTFAVLAGLAMAAIPWKLKKREYLFVLLCVPFAAAAAYAVRLIPYFVIAVLPGAGSGFREAILWARRKGKVPAAAAMVGLYGAAAFLLVRDYHRTVQSMPPGWGADRLHLPEAAVEFILEKDLSGLMYNDFGQGGYLAWRLFPGRRVFQDGRGYAYPAEFFQETLGSMNQQSWARLMEKYGITFAVVQRRPNTHSRIDVAPLFESLGWKLVFLDGISYVYVMPETADMARVGGVSLHPVLSSDTAQTLRKKGRMQPDQMQKALHRIDPGRLILTDDFYRFGVAAFAAGDWEKSERFLRTGVERHPEDFDLMVNLAALLVSRGRKDEARDIFSTVSKRGAGTPAGRVAEEQLRKIPP